MKTSVHFVKINESYFVYLEVFMNRRILCLLMVLIMAISLFACKSNSDSEDMATLDSEVGISGESEDSGESEGEEKPSQTPSQESDQSTQKNEGKEEAPSEEKGGEKEPAQSEDQPSEEKEPSSESEETPEKPKEQNKVNVDHLINDESGTKLKILCQNLRYNAESDRGTDNFAGVRRYRFQVLMEKYDPDVVGLQECDKTWIEYLQQDYGREYTMFYQYRGSTGGSDEATPIMWKTEKYKLVNSGYFWLSNTPSEASASFVKNSHPRIVTWVKLKDKETGTYFNVYSTHFGFYEEDAHIDKIRNLIENSFRSAGEYSFIMGDFNIAYEDNQYNRLMQTNLLGDLRPVSEAMAKEGVCELGDIRNGAYNAFKYPDGGVFGDYIMAKPNRKLAVDYFGYLYDMPAVPEQNIEAGYVSDHFAVYAEVRMGTKQSYEKYWGVF